MCDSIYLSPNAACAALGQHRSTQRKAPRGFDDEKALIADIIELARQYGRYGYRKVAALLRDAGWLVKRQAARADLAMRGAQGAAADVQALARFVQSLQNGMSI